MSSQEIPVEVELRTTIEDNGQMEYNTIKHPGTLYQKGNLDVIIFEEETEEENVTTKNLLTIQSGKVNIKRTGEVKMNQQFLPNQTTENVYKHPYGVIHMETYTNSINYQPLYETDNGYLGISYSVKLNGQEERKHELALTFMEEGS
ncbi:uncharacterized beta-barrel protein YwiB (DUF1934 family) [Virgibacillus natechei]|uniref:Uncharacterized beta-barrel protein YwiB (DUF1934 family) n=1 Tax=Virgibacillus natechei TaxID=1216297 RepID=A0ABS4IFV6_9BACI|nr:DUF1934 domain-containing protein [Virgibacillus natechei]MBP1969829.1 uncharacterized beta-barrel protein YwiB (DUF1934 family) [Virgibacillus natechei]UZD12639.1 DUF1934 domain-containing protein [Virgibacillus natechei]